jgi:hypothetical protein
MRESPALDDEDLWFPAHMSAGDSFSRPMSADGAATEATSGAAGDNDGIGLPRRRTGGSGGGPRKPKKTGSKKGGVKASSWLWFTLWGAAALGIAGYAARKEIATELAQSWLKGQGVPSRLHFDSLSLGHATGSFVLGVPGRPDISAGRFDADFNLNPFAAGGQPSARLVSARLDQVSVHLSYKDGKLGLGTLDRLVHNLSTGPQTPGAPPKSITLNDVSVMVDSDYGTLEGKGGAALRDGRLTYLELKLAPARLDGTRGGGDFGGGDVLVRGVSGNQLQVEAKLSAAQLELRDGGGVVEGAPARHVAIQGASLDVSGRVPYRDDGVISGPIDAVVALTAQGLRAQGLTVADADYRVRLDGRIKDGAQYDGNADVAGQVGRATGAGVDVRKAAVSVVGLKVHAAAGSLSVKGAATADAAQLTQGGVSVRAAHIQATRLDLTSDATVSHVDFGGTVAAGGMHAGELDLSHTAATLAGALDTDATSGAWALKAQGAVTSDGSYSGLHAVAHGRAAGDDMARIDRGLSHFTARMPGFMLSAESEAGDPADIDLRLKAPVQASLDGGLSLDVAPLAGQPLFASHKAGGFGLDLKGGPQVALDVSGLTLAASGAVSGDYDLDGQFTTAPVTGAKVVARGHFSTANGLSAPLSQPLTFTAQSADLGDTFTHLSGALRQAGNEFLQADGSGWRVNGTFEGLALDAPNEQLRVKNAQGTLGAFSIAGSESIGLKASLATADLSDSSPAADERFHPLVLNGTLTQDARAMTGRFTAAAPGFKTAGRPTPVVAIDLDNDTAAQRGQLRLRTLDLTFAPGGLQPHDLSQMGTAVLAKSVTGTLSFDGGFRWDHAKTSSAGILKVDGLSFAGAIGTAEKLQGEIDFTSLSPLLSQPNQLLGIYRMQVGLPLSDLAMSLQFQGDRIAIEKATVNTPGGAVRLEPMSVAFDPKMPIEGAASFDGLDFGKVIATTGLSDSLTFEGKLSGRVPFSILGGHITFTRGWMAADGPGTISIKRQAITGVAASGSVTGDGQGAAATLQPAFNPFQDLAYQALEHVHYDQLDAKINSQPGGVLDTTFHLKGRFTPPQTQKAQISLLDYLNGTWTQKPLKLPSGTPVELYLDVPVNLDDILDSVAQFGK